MKSRPHISLATLILALAAAGWPPGDATAAETPAINPTGTWKLAYTSNGYTDPAKKESNASDKKPAWQPNLRLKLAGGKLTGTLSRRRAQVEIEMPLQDAKLNASEISFTVATPPESGQGPSMVRKFHGKITGDLIKGTVDVVWSENFTRDWEAKRVKE
jgi:hypothetical protein